MNPVRPARETDHAGILNLLSAWSLPVSDIDFDSMQFLISERDDTLQGIVALQCAGNLGLLRSLAVDPAARSTGLGSDLVVALEKFAQTRGLTGLVLLTETAAPFFARLGYRQAERASMPPEVQATAEFRSLCPSTAKCLSKTFAKP
jgi:amino-acid N-acetyltransferase